MRAALDVVKEAYKAYGRGDLPALLEMVAEKTDWKFIGPVSLPYAGLRTDRKQVADFFDALARARVYRGRRARHRSRVDQSDRARYPENL